MNAETKARRSRTGKERRATVSDKKMEELMTEGDYMALAEGDTHHNVVERK